MPIFPRDRIPQVPKPYVPPPNRLPSGGASIPSKGTLGAGGKAYPNSPSMQAIDSATQAANLAREQGDEIRRIRMDEAGVGSAELGNTYLQSQIAANAPTRMSNWESGVQIRQPAYENQAQTALEAKFAREAATAREAASASDFERRQTAGAGDFDRRLSAIRSLSGGSPGLDDTANIVSNEQAARDAAFARAKDTQGQIARSSLDALSGIMSERGMLGGGYEGAGQAAILGGAQANLGETARGQALSDVERSGQIADRNYAGSITKRGQDMSKLQSLLGILSSSRAY